MGVGMEEGTRELSRRLTRIYVKEGPFLGRTNDEHFLLHPNAPKAPVGAVVLHLVV